MPSVAFDDDLLEKLRDVPAGEPVTFVSKSDPSDRITFLITPFAHPPLEPDIILLEADVADPPRCRD